MRFKWIITIWNKQHPARRKRRTSETHNPQASSSSPLSESAFLPLYLEEWPFSFWWIWTYKYVNRVKNVHSIFMVCLCNPDLVPCVEWGGTECIFMKALRCHRPAFLKAWSNISSSRNTCRDFFKKEDSWASLQTQWIRSSSNERAQKSPFYDKLKWDFYTL